MYTRGLSVEGSGIKTGGPDLSKQRPIGRAYGLDERMQPTPEALANALLWAGASDVVYAAQIVINLSRAGCETDWAVNDLEAAIKKATIPAQGAVTLSVTMAAVME